MKIAHLLLALSVLCLAGCTVLTEVDTSFLNIEEPEEDASVPECDQTGIVELPHECFDGCDNDGDDDIDCADSDCTNYCCDQPEEWFNCDDQCDNDRDGLIDCDDPDCVGTTVCTPAPVREGLCRGAEDDPDCCDPEHEDYPCCDNDKDDDGDGLEDCEDSDCQSSDFCCGTESTHRENSNNGFDEGEWIVFQGRDGEPLWENNRIVDWRDNDLIGGATRTDSIPLSFGLSMRFVAVITEASEACHPRDCPSFAGMALGPASAPMDATEPLINLAVVVTSAHRVVVMRADRVLHSIGLDPPPPTTGAVTPADVTVNLLPATNDQGENGFRMQLEVEGGRSVCHQDGTITGCPLEPEWISDELVLYDEDNVLLNESRGSYLMVIGHGSGVELSDEETSTISIDLRSCANPSAWSPAPGDDRIGNEHVCWAVGALASPSISHVGGQEYVMVAEGTTNEVSVSGYGINNYSLAWLDIDDDPTLQHWNQSPDVDDRDATPTAFHPIDTDYDLNCMEYGDPNWPEVCRGWLLAFPQSVESRCEGALSHRSPHVIGTSGIHDILFAEATRTGRPYYHIRAASYSGAGWAIYDTEDHELTLDEVEHATTGHYRSLRDPVAICHPDSMGSDSCDGRYMVLVVAEPDVTVPEQGGWTGDDLIYVEYDFGPAGGFDTTTLRVALDGGGDSNPIPGRELAEPWVIWDPNTATYFVWITTNLPGQDTQVDLLLVPSGEVQQTLEDPAWELYTGSPVLTVRDLETLYDSEDHRAADCSGRCEIGGVTGVVVQSEGGGQELLHFWVGVAEMPASDDPPTYHIRHLQQYFGLP